jgi:hypothetical protein
MIFFIKMLYKVFLFNLAQFSLIIDNSKQPILEEHTHCLHLEHYTPIDRTCINFPKNDISV